MEQIDIPQERRYCSKLGFSALAIMLWSILWQFGLYWLDGWILPFRMPETLYYLLLLVGHYAVSLPIVFCLWRKTPPMPFCRERAGAKRMGRWFVIGCALMWLGSLIGTNINDMVYALTGRDPVGMVDESFSQMPMAAIVLGACIIGPLCEELVFRGLLAGRLARYGQKPGAFISALLFGLYHANLEQFFYAFALGLFWMAMLVIGIILLVRGRKQQVWLHGPCAPSLKAVLQNAGMFLLIVACFVQTVFNYL